MRGAPLRFLSPVPQSAGFSLAPGGVTAAGLLRPARIYGGFMGSISYTRPGKHTKNYGTSPFLVRKSTTI